MSWISDWFHRPALVADPVPSRVGGPPGTVAPDLPRLRLGPGADRTTMEGGTRHLEELQVVVLKLSGLRCSLQVPDDGPPFLSVCRAEAVRMRQTVWCEPATLPPAVPPDGTAVCCTDASVDTSCGFVWEAGRIAPAYEVFEAAILVIAGMTASHPSGGPALR
ncbi:hypothetical protein [Actinomadura harenae]|uniref:Uncharacterized protein n=1 Tax=Actinomadura harenae TaxID=2483351 RepID=A0A3M2LQ99_9ACTN|nr:hypothetical protein [Actinomadura harenae]RMI39641.1 hypothetical protein EBO15_29185 [Actinomadura harenae]